MSSSCFVTDTGPDDTTVGDVSVCSARIAAHDMAGDLQTWRQVRHTERSSCDASSRKSVKPTGGLRVQSDGVDVVRKLVYSM